MALCTQWYPNAKVNLWALSGNSHFQWEENWRRLERLAYSRLSGIPSTILDISRISKYWFLQLASASSMQYVGCLMHSLRSSACLSRDENYVQYLQDTIGKNIKTLLMIGKSQIIGLITVFWVRPKMSRWITHRTDPHNKYSAPGYCHHCRIHYWNPVFPSPSIYSLKRQENVSFLQKTACFWRLESDHKSGENTAYVIVRKGTWVGTLHPYLIIVCARLFFLNSRIRQRDIRCRFCSTNVDSVCTLIRWKCILS